MSRFLWAELLLPLSFLTGFNQQFPHSRDFRGGDSLGKAGPAVFVGFAKYRDVFSGRWLFPLGGGRCFFL